MNKEEKEAIGNLKIIAEYIGENYFFGKQGIENLKKDINVTLNYLNHLHKEIEEQKEREKYTHKLEKELDKKDKVIKELENKLEKHIKFCKQEASGHIENNVCHISLKFEKRLLEEIKKVEEENES